MTSTRSESRASSDAVRRFEYVLHDFVERLGNLGAIAAIDVRGVGRTYFASGFADLERSEPARPTHLFQIGSQSKTFVALTLVILAQRGVLCLDDAVVDHLDLAIDRRITIRHLLMNMSGLGEYTRALLSARFDPRVRIAPRALVDMALPQGPIFEPGACFDYCNTGWVIAALLLEKITGAPYADSIRKIVLTPLGLDNTAFGGGDPAGPALRGYIKVASEPRPVDTSTGSAAWAFGAGDGVSSLDDLLDLYVQLSSPTNPLGVSLGDLIRTTGKPSTSPYFPMSIGTEYGLGVERRCWAGRDVWGHPGSVLTCVTATWTDPEMGVTVTTCVTRNFAFGASDDDLRYPRAQLFAMALNTGYAIAESAGRVGVA